MSVDSVGGGVAFAVQGSQTPDFANFATLPMFSPSGGLPVTFTSTVGHYKIGISTRYVRIRSYVYVSGTPAITVQALQQSLAPLDTVEQVHGNSASGATDIGNPVKVGGKHNTATITLADGQRGDFQISKQGFLKTMAGDTVRYTTNSANTVNDAVVFNGSCTIIGIIAMQSSGGQGYVRIYDKGASAPTTTDIPITGTGLNAAPILSWVMNTPIPMTNGIGIRITQGAAINDNTAVNAGAVQVVITYVVK
jgi:hypothetical protein